MPWYMNVTRDVIRTVMADGSHIGFDPRETEFVPAAQMSADIAILIKKNKLRYRGSGLDLEPPQAPPAEATQPDIGEAVEFEADIAVVVTPDDESNMLATSDIEGAPETDSGDGAPEPERRRRRKRQ
jgi:hypothetical protein